MKLMKFNDKTKRNKKEISLWGIVRLPLVTVGYPCGRVLALFSSLSSSFVRFCFLLVYRYFHSYFHRVSLSPSSYSLLRFPCSLLHLCFAFHWFSLLPIPSRCSTVSCRVCSTLLLPAIWFLWFRLAQFPCIPVSHTLRAAPHTQPLPYCPFSFCWPFIIS